jgi:hypothetical protein
MDLKYGELMLVMPIWRPKQKKRSTLLLGLNLVTFKDILSSSIKLFMDFEALG